MENSAAILFKLYIDVSIIDQLQTLPISKLKFLQTSASSTIQLC